MNRSLFTAILLFSACSATNNFLPTDSRAWNDWLNASVEVDLQKIPLADLARRGPFKDKPLVFTGVDGEAIISLTAPDRITRRQALRLLAEQYGLTIAFVQRDGQPAALQISNRELRRENKPLR